MKNPAATIRASKTAGYLRYVRKFYFIIFARIPRGHDTGRQDHGVCARYAYSYPIHNVRRRSLILVIGNVSCRKPSSLVMAIDIIMEFELT